MIFSKLLIAKWLLLCLAPFALVLFAATLPGSTSAAQTSKVTIYAAVLSNKSFTVGQRNPGTGLYVGDAEGKTWSNITFSNLRMFDIEMFPHYNNGLFYTANGNGVMVSHDSGQTWRVTTGWEITEVLEIAAVQTNPGVVYIGTAYGVWKSTDFGEHWQRLTQRFINALLIDHADPERIFVGEEKGLIISSNGGKSFKTVPGLDDAVNALGQHPARPEWIIAGTEDHGLFFSKNRGKSFQQIRGETETCTIYSITFDANKPDRAYASTFASGVLITEDGGQSWRISRKGLEDMAVHDVAVHPQNSDILYAGTVNFGIYRSTDAGQTWKPFALDGTQVWRVVVTD